MTPSIPVQVQSLSPLRALLFVPTTSIHFLSFSLDRLSVHCAGLSLYCTCHCLPYSLFTSFVFCSQLRACLFCYSCFFFSPWKCTRLYSAFYYSLIVWKSVQFFEPQKLALRSWLCHFLTMTSGQSLFFSLFYLQN